MKNRKRNKNSMTLCEEFGCFRYACYGHGRLKHCRLHRRINEMLLLKRHFYRKPGIQICEYPFCLLAKLQGIDYCDQHKDLYRYRTCREPGCGIRPTYGILLGRPVFCKRHKSDCHYDVYNPKCDWSGCPKRALYGKKGEKPTTCREHKSDNQVNCRACIFEDCKRILTP